MATLVRKSKGSKSNVNVRDGRTFNEVCKKSWTVEEFLEEFEVKGGLDVVSNPQKINEITGRPNLFLSFRTEDGNVTGAIANKVQQHIIETGKAPARPMIGLFDVNGEEVYTLYDQGEGNSPILTLTVD